MESHSFAAAVQFQRFSVYISKHYAPQGVLAKTSTTGVAAFWIVVMLLAYLVIGLF